MSVARDKAGAKPLLDLVQHGSAQNRRAAAEALGRLVGGSNATNRLLASFENMSPEMQHDRVLEHSLIYAAIEIDNAVAIRAWAISSA